MSTESSLKEYIFATDDKYQPKVLEGKDASYVLVIRLLLLEPGTIQTHPEMGIGLISRYRYIDKDQLYTLEQEINKQMKKYLPTLLTDTSVSLSTSSNQLIINISTGTESQQVVLDTDTGNLTLADL